MAKPKHLIPFTSLRIVDDNGIVKINEGVETKRKKKKLQIFMKTQLHESCHYNVQNTTRGKGRGATNIAFPSGYHRFIG